MKKKILVKVVVASVLFIILGAMAYFDEVRKSELGKAEYLKRQAIFFDKYLTPPQGSILVSFLFLGFILFGIYELICYYLLKPKNKNKISN